MADEPKAHLDDIAAAVEAAMERLEARNKIHDAEEKRRAAEKESLSNRVSVAALALTMLLSFLGFARSERDDAAKEQHHVADKARQDAEDNWTLYQNRAAERAGYMVAEDQITREASGLAEDDSRYRLAALNHVEYATRVSQLDNENRHVFFVIEALERPQARAQRAAAHIEQKIERYDMGTRVLTLALIILSVTLLANQSRLFLLGVIVAFAGAGIAVSGYFMS